MHRPPVLLSALALVVALALPACSKDTGGAIDITAPPPTTSTTAAAACDAPFAEPLDPNSSKHVLPDAPEPRYTTDPPTSGPHRPGKHQTGVLPDSVAPSVQVAMLEGGEILIQHRDLQPNEFDELTSVATATVSVAPNPTLPAKIIATAWQFKLVCRGVDLPAVRAFIAAHLKPESAH